MDLLEQATGPLHVVEAVRRIDDLEPLGDYQREKDQDSGRHVCTSFAEFAPSVRGGMAQQNHASPAGRIGYCPT